jgi:hypothetical protein
MQGVVACGTACCLHTDARQTRCCAAFQKPSLTQFRACTARRPLTRVLRDWFGVGTQDIVGRNISSMSTDMEGFDK